MDYTKLPSVRYAEMSQDAYLPEGAFKEKHPNSELFSIDGHQAYVVSLKDEVIIACRGTELELEDLLTDLRVTARDMPEGKLHDGFLGAASKLSLVMAQTVFVGMLSGGPVTNKKSRMTICGHSMGGAIAQLLAYLFSEYKPAVYCYGTPAIANEEFQEYYNMTFQRCYNYMNDSDPVPVLLSRKYHKLGKLYYIEDNGNVVHNPGFWWRFKRFIFDKCRLGEHGIAEYIRRLSCH